MTSSVLREKSVDCKLKYSYIDVSNTKIGQLSKKVQVNVFAILLLVTEVVSLSYN